MVLSTNYTECMLAQNILPIIVPLGKQASTISEVASDSSNDVMESIQSDLNRLDRAEKATEVVEQALEALQQKLCSMTLKGKSSSVSKHKFSTIAIHTYILIYTFPLPQKLITQSLNTNTINFFRFDKPLATKMPH